MCKAQRETQGEIDSFRRPREKQIYIEDLGRKTDSCGRPREKYIHLEDLGKKTDSCERHKELNLCERPRESWIYV